METLAMAQLMLLWGLGLVAVGFAIEVLWSTFRHW
jgi:hypothetical protein